MFLNWSHKSVLWCWSKPEHKVTCAEQRILLRISFFLALFMKYTQASWWTKRERKRLRVCRFSNVPRQAVYSRILGLCTLPLLSACFKTYVCFPIGDWISFLSLSLFVCACVWERNIHLVIQQKRYHFLTWSNGGAHLYTSPIPWSQFTTFNIGFSTLHHHWKLLFCICCCKSDKHGLEWQWAVLCLWSVMWMKLELEVRKTLSFPKND